MGLKGNERLFGGRFKTRLLRQLSTRDIQRCSEPWKGLCMNIFFSGDSFKEMAGTLNAVFA
jgi:hypothetical protein